MKPENCNRFRNQSCKKHQQDQFRQNYSKNGVQRWRCKQRHMGATPFKAVSAAQTADEMTALGSAYAVYGPSIVSNAIGGDVLASLEFEQLPMLFSTVGVTNTIHQAKLMSLLKLHRPSLLQRTLSQAKQLDVALNMRSKTQRFEVFLSHDWGVDGATHAKVGLVNTLDMSTAVLLYRRRPSH
ncbi:hypothetical protein DYB25_001118 [Aphanomyces astaci]|uniref:SAM domain-containing protein n=1 Tax=Aphanomyces astaci TaxID=112090 RepID=A0A397DBM5_APHAT|nr:hypothetical protein DYB25_001118 [Aphanomyces astaci]RHY19662.1 hypothetical protein DYB36_000323 [Aphanomyces astaci]RHY55342.1 hypothetical protein DYB34_000143 [Aphanomyces astaci]RHY61652.1 hypothetical protein DYB30_001978 [Aphanomyces astaci]RHY70824.1 hypothetical protein DYB38_000886 [Aphanomyces astaci]